MAGNNWNRSTVCVAVTKVRAWRVTCISQSVDDDGKFRRLLSSLSDEHLLESARNPICKLQFEQLANNKSPTYLLVSFICFTQPIWWRHVHKHMLSWPFRSLTRQQQTKTLPLCLSVLSANSIQFISIQFDPDSDLGPDSDLIPIQVWNRFADWVSNFQNRLAEIWLNGQSLLFSVVSSTTSNRGLFHFLSLGSRLRRGAYSDSFEPPISSLCVSVW